MSFCIRWGEVEIDAKTFSFIYKLFYFYISTATWLKFNRNKLSNQNVDCDSCQCFEVKQTSVLGTFDTATWLLVT